MKHRETCYGPQQSGIHVQGRCHFLLLYLATFFVTLVSQVFQPTSIWYCNWIIHHQQHYTSGQVFDSFQVLHLVSLSMTTIHQFLTPSLPCINSINFGFPNQILKQLPVVLMRLGGLYSRCNTPRKMYRQKCWELNPTTSQLIITCICNLTHSLSCTDWLLISCRSVILKIYVYLTVEEYGHFLSCAFILYLISQKKGHRFEVTITIGLFQAFILIWANPIPDLIHLYKFSS